MLRRLDHLSFKGNLKHTRYGWLRLTPAYSVHVVGEILDAAQLAPGARVLDPFCGTGTTALVCAERGIACDTTDINPFLLWLARAKTRKYSARAIAAARALKTSGRGKAAWVPALHQIEKWWDGKTLAALARVRAAIDEVGGAAGDLCKLAFCRTLIECANVSFGHQSMSFKQTPARAVGSVADAWTHALASITESAASSITVAPRAIECDARDLTAALDDDAYALVITSPPYPNRMSYIRELRPYMYWLGYLRDGRAAGELDWRAMGGTWGTATSNVARWTPPAPRAIPWPGFDAVLRGVGARSDVLSRYLHKYFYDMVDHVAGLYRVVAPGGRVHYVVGNSKFYDVLVPVEEIFAGLFAAAGFANANVRAIRKRTSKKELYEYVVTADKPTKRPTASSSARRRSAASSA